METTYALNENETLQEIKRPPRIGFIKTFAGTTPPEGTLLCDGSAISRDTYSELFAAIGTTWGSGDGANTFNLPDLRDVWILCAGPEHEAGDVVAEGLPNITGYLQFRNGRYANGIHGGGNIISVPTDRANAIAQGIQDAPTPFEDFITTSVGEGNYAGHGITFTASKYNSIYGAQAHVTPASVAVLPCIVYE